MHDSGNWVFVTAPPDPAFIDDLERQLLIEERPQYSNEFGEPTRRFRITHREEPRPSFRSGSDSIVGWNGQVIQGARSRGARVFAACDWRQLLLAPGEPIEQKAKVGSTHLNDFHREDHLCLTYRDTRYSDVQSLRSEDTVTWSVFGVLEPAVWAADLLELSFGPAEWPQSWEACFWKRLPHPDTGSREHGPEADITIESDGNRFYAIEAKWLSDISRDQGQSGQKTQLDMRAASVASITAIPRRRGVIVIVPRPSRYPPAQAATSVFRRYFFPEGDRYRSLATAGEVEACAITWEQIAERLSLKPAAKEIVNYLTWRLRFLD